MLKLESVISVEKLDILRECQWDGGLYRLYRKRLQSCLRLIYFPYG